MFFFIGGVQPKTVFLEDHPRMCPFCGLYQARLKRVDHYVSLFFLRLFRVKKGEPFLECQRCGTISGGMDHRAPETTRTVPLRCPHCGRPVEASYHYCPSCGRPLH